jgi:hypothetical protein
MIKSLRTYSIHAVGLLMFFCAGMADAGYVARFCRNKQL